MAFWRSSSLKRSWPRILPYFSAPWMKAAAICSGSSSRESSSVIITISECLARIAPRMGLVEGSRWPAPP